MPLRWKLFAVANYLLLAGYLFLLILIVKFLFETNIRSTNGLLEFILISTSMLFIVVNSVCNVYVFHKHLRGKPFNYNFKIFYTIFSVLYLLSLAVVLISLIPAIADELRYSERRRFGYFLVTIFSFTLILGGFVLINQFLVRRYIKRKNQDEIGKMINEIGNSQ